MTCQMVYHNGNCLNTKKPYARACKLCIESCPHQAISEYRELETNRCTECGACMAVCPSNGFVDRTMDNLYNYLLEAKEIVLNCPRAVPEGFEISCLGILDRDSWMTLMLQAKEKNVRIIAGVCSECEDRPACAASVQAFNKIHLDWPDHPPIHIQVRPDKECTLEQEVSERVGPKSINQGGTRTGWRQKGRQKIEEWLPRMTADEAYPIPKSRLWLIEAFQKSAEDTIPFHALSVADSCTSCGVCAAICPQGALLKREERTADPETEDPTKEEKITSMRLIFEPQKCVQCHRCVETCRTKALSFSYKPLAHRLLTGKILIHEGTPKYCRQCGKRIFDNAELCLVCSTSDPDKREFFSL